MNFSEDFFDEDYFFGKKKSNYFDCTRWDNNGYWRPTIKAIRKYKMNGKALDIGCAFGFFLKRIKPFFDEIHGIDISSFAIGKAKEVIPEAKLKVVDINKGVLPYPDKYFDLITALDVLEHTNSIEKSLKTIIPKLKSGGYLIIFLPVRDTWAGKIFGRLDKDQSHVSIPNRKKLFQIIDELGLAVVEKRYSMNLIYFRLRGIPLSLEVILRSQS